MKYLEFFRRGKITLPPVTPMEIICGDCVGEDFPIKTNLRSDGSCAVCGSHSFVCATRYFKVTVRHLLSQKTEEVSK